MLQFAEKYNWWTPVEKKAELSLEAKIEYILIYGTLDELRRMMKETGGKAIFDVWNKIQTGIPKNRQHVIAYFVAYHQNDTL